MNEISERGDLAAGLLSDMDRDTRVVQSPSNCGRYTEIEAAGHKLQKAYKLALQIEQISGVVRDEFDAGFGMPHDVVHNTIYTISTVVFEACEKYGFEPDGDIRTVPIRVPDGADLEVVAMRIGQAQSLIAILNRLGADGSRLQFDEGFGLPHGCIVDWLGGINELLGYAAAMIQGRAPAERER